MIPQNRWSLNVRGVSGSGKSVFVAHLASMLRETEGLNVAIVEKEWRRKRMEQIYGKVLPLHEIKWYKGLSFPMLESLNNTILIQEDMFFFNKKSFKVLEQLVHGRARDECIFTICIGQHSKIYMPSTLNAEVRVREDGIHVFRMRDDKICTRETAIECDQRGFIPEEKMYEALVAIYSPLEKTGKLERVEKRAGFYSQCVDAFSQGATPKQVCNVMGFTSQSSDYVKVYSYFTRWKIGQAVVISKLINRDQDGAIAENA